MKTKNLIFYAIIIALTAFALLTLFLSSSIIFDWFGIRAKEGNYVLFIVWANFICSILYLATSFGIITQKVWVLQPIKYSLILLLVAFIGLLIYIQNGGIFEMKTVYAMGFRIIVTLLFYMYIKSNVKTWNHQSSRN